MPIHHLGSLKRVTVFLNPAANDGKAANFYQKYAAPILHLAGLDVHLVTVSQFCCSRKRSVWYVMCSAHIPYFATVHQQICSYVQACLIFLPSVLLIQLEFDGQAKQLISIVDNTDMIIVAGGDGTLTEVVTGLLRRPDNVNNIMTLFYFSVCFINTLIMFCATIDSNTEIAKNTHWCYSTGKEKQNVPSPLWRFGI